MGKAEIIENRGNGYYLIKLLFDTSRATAELEALPKKISDTKGFIAAAENEFEKLALEARLLSLEKRKEYLENNIPEDREVESFCIDETSNLSGIVATIEALGEIHDGMDVFIRPGYYDQAQYVPEKNGQLQPMISNTPAAAFYNYAILPGWQKFKPLHRFGRITALNSTSCDINLSGHTSSVGDYEIDQTDTLDNVPFYYRGGDLSQFEVNDRVVVEFIDQDWSKPQVIGTVGPIEQDQYVWKWVDRTDDRFWRTSIVAGYVTWYGPKNPDGTTNPTTEYKYCENEFIGGSWDINGMRAPDNIRRHHYLDVVRRLQANGFAGWRPTKARVTVTSFGPWRSYPDGAMISEYAIIINQRGYGIGTALYVNGSGTFELDISTGDGPDFDMRSIDFRPSTLIDVEQWESNEYPEGQQYNYEYNWYLQFRVSKIEFYAYLPIDQE